LAGSDTAAASPQTAGEATKVPTFAVISVKRNLTAQTFGGRYTPDGYSGDAMTLEWLLSDAYGFHSAYQIFGAPEWASTYRYDIRAKVDDSDVEALHKLNWNLRYQMMRQILTDRFKIKVHIEKRVQPIYSLIVVNRDRLPPPSDPKSINPNLITRGRPGQLTAKSLTMENFAKRMSGSLGRMVVDNTGVSDPRDFKLDWNPAETDTSESTSSAPSIFTAVQEQLGLKLVPSTGPVECLVIDHVEIPSEN
jgi:uncharacterized protein (TIGR03435 family)